MVKGIARRKKRHAWSREIIIAVITKLNNDGKSISSRDTQVRRQTLFRAACKYFGGWKQAVEASGIDYSVVRKHRSYRQWSKAEVAKAIQERGRRGLSLNYSAVSREDTGLRWAAKQYFGKKSGWAKALKFAGIDPRKLPDPRRKWTKEKIRDEILSRHARGLPVNSPAMGNLASTAYKLFGKRSWRKAIRFSGLSSQVHLNKKSWWTPKRIASQIQRMEKSGIRLSSGSMQKFHNALYMAAVYHFGSWSQAVDAAGIDYRQHCLMWSTKAWVRRLSTADVAQIKKRVRKLAK
jgi:hypothetical protein